MRFVARSLSVLLAVGAFVSIGSSSSSQEALPPDTATSGKLLYVHDVTEWARFGRWSALREHNIHALAQISKDQYCAEYSTTVIEEARDLQSSQGHDVAMQVKGKDVFVTLNGGRHIKMHLVKNSECPRT